MSLKLIARGRRNHNRFHLARGSVAGRIHEFCTRETDWTKAERRAAELELVLLSRDSGGFAPARSFTETGLGFQAYWQPSPRTRRCLERLADALGELALEKVRPHHLVGAAHELHPGACAATWNSQVLVPAAGTLYFSARQHWIPYEPIGCVSALNWDPGRDLYIMFIFAESTIGRGPIGADLDPSRFAFFA